MAMMLQMQTRPEVFYCGETVRHYARKCYRFEDSVAGVQAANIAQMTVLVLVTKNLHEAKYIFEDFTQIENSFEK
jgi:beta-phosphoglucomutase